MSSDTDQRTSPWTAFWVVMGVFGLFGVLAATMLPAALNSETTEHVEFCDAYGKPSVHVQLLEQALGPLPAKYSLDTLRDVEKDVFDDESTEDPLPGLGQAARVFREAMLQALDEGSLTPVQTPEVQQAITTLEGRRNTCEQVYTGSIKD